MKPLYSTSDWKLAKTRDLLPLECLECKGKFFRSKHRVQTAIKRGFGDTAEFCSVRCARLKQHPPITVKCEQCSVQFVKIKSQIKRCRHNFCSCSCSTTYNNQHKTIGNRRSKLEIWLESQMSRNYPSLVIKYNDKEAIQSELDIYIPSLRLAFELNGIFHYEPIYGVSKLSSIQKNDVGKFQKCIAKGIELCVIDVSTLKHFKIDKAIIFLEIITNIVNQRLNNGAPRGI